MHGQEIFAFSKTSRPPLGPTQPFIQWVAGSFPGGKVPTLRIDGAVPLLPLYAFML
jgi:hypothetical protein